ncbi:MAG: hypothetical protein IPM95_02730 [Sphingobacteriales bacterium]|jgi:hypothetical protein|nr:hypothetical protein [Sphingobacteriales bacterium]
MKKVLLISLFLALAGSGYAKKDKTNCAITGTWKYSNSSAINDFQRISNLRTANYTSEYLVFNDRNEFKHEFVDENGLNTRTLKGKWKIFGTKIKISYTDIDFELLVDYFFMDNDLVLGKNLNHIIFTKDAFVENNLALK